MSDISLNKDLLLNKTSNIINKLDQEIKKQENSEKTKENKNFNNDNKDISKLSSKSMNSLSFIDSDVSKSFVGIVNLAYSSVENKLTQSQKETALVMKDAFEKVVAGKPITLRASFLLTVSTEVFKVASQMSEQQVEELSKNKEMRAKVLMKHNKNIDKMINAKSINDFSKEEIAEIEKTYKIKVVQENNEVSFYYTDSEGNQKKITKDELKQLKIDLNNIITSPDLFNFTMVAGKSNFQFTEDKENINYSDFNDNQKDKDIQHELEHKKEKLDDNKDNFINKLNENVEVKEINTNIKDKNLDSKIVEQAFFKKVLEKEEEEKRYHLKKLNEITEIRRNIENELNEKRLDEKYKK